MRASAKVLGVALALLTFAALCIWYAALREDNRGRLTLSYLQSGAVFVEAPSGRQILIDGGPDDSVLRQLGALIPFYDHSIDLLIATAPTANRIGGLSDVLARYQSAAIVQSAASSGAPQAEAFDAAVASAEEKGTRLIIAKRGDVIDLGAGSYLEALFPDRDASAMGGSGCLFLRLTFGATSFLFPCGSAAIEDYVAMLDGNALKSDVLFAEGADSPLFLGFVSPQYLVEPCGAASSSASSGETTQTVSACGGTRTFISDGQTITSE